MTTIAQIQLEMEFKINFGQLPSLLTVEWMKFRIRFVNQSDGRINTFSEH